MLLMFITFYKAQQSPLQSSDVSTLPKIVPPSPTSSALGNYGNVPVGYFTGSLNIQVPLMEFKSGSINVPIYLFYGSNGIKVDDVSGNVGLGWNLNFGGIITKTIRDLDDDLQLSVPIPENFIPGPITNSITNAFYHEAGNALADSERDLYSFNFNGYSGKFILNQSDNKPILYSQDNLEIKRINSSGFSITTKEGIKFYFSEQEKTSFRMSGNGFSEPIPYYPTAWYLSKIMDVNGNEVYFNYTNGGITYDSSQSQTLKILYPSPQVGCGGLLSANPQVGQIITQHMSVNGKKINKIFSNNPNDGEIIFQYESSSDSESYFKVSSITKKDTVYHSIEKADFSYEVTNNDRTFLKKISFKDPNKSYAFEYINKEIFPLRLSYAQDHWGYFNGKDENVNLLPSKIGVPDLENVNYQGSNKEPNWNYAQIGMLSKISYPTKGFTNIEYEGNDYFGTKIIQPLLKEHRLSIVTEQSNGNASASKQIIVETSHWMKISGRSFFNIDCNVNIPENTSVLDVMDENNDPVQLWLYSDTFSQYTPAYNNQLMEDGQEYFIEAIAGKKYTIKLSTHRRCTSAYCDIYYLDGKEEISHENLPTGGVRIKSTEDFNSDGLSSNFKRYYYKSDNSLSSSSGDIGASPFYYDLRVERISCSTLCNFKENTFLVVSSSSMIPLFNSGNSNCYYSDIFISNGGNNFEKGGEHKKYIINRDEEGKLIFGLHKPSNTTWSNLSWNNGLEESTVIFDSMKTPIKEVTSNYSIKDNFTKVGKSYSVRNNFLEGCIPGITHYCTQYETENYPLNRCYNRTPGQTVNLLVVTNLDIVEYQNISQWHYLKSQKTIDYLNGTPLETTTEYFYNNPAHYQLTQKKTIFPDSSTQTTEYQYAHEKGNTYLMEKNMVGLPLQTMTYESDILKPISKNETIYPVSQPDADTKTSGLPLPVSVSSLDFKTNAMETKLSYKQYDNNGNIQQYTLNPDANGNGTPVTIIWGYNQSQPIAKIEGATYAQVSGNISDIVTYSNTDATQGTPTSEQDLINKLDEFRAKPGLIGYQITTYTYNPLIGVTSITPPSGIREVYIYDTANRLKEVREQNATGNLLKEYQYHYKP